MGEGEGGIYRERWGRDRERGRGRVRGRVRFRYLLKCIDDGDNRGVTYDT